MKWIVTENDDSKFVREFLREKGLSRRIITSVKFEGGFILVNDEASTVVRKLQTNDTVEIIFPPEVRGPFMKPENIPLSIVYEDNDVLVIDKPAGIATIPSLHHTSGTVANGLIAYYDKNDINYTAHIVTRLDRDTSGLLLVAKHRHSHSILSTEQKLGKVNRSYCAVVEGHLRQKQGKIDAPIGRKPDSIIERTVTSSGQKAITHYTVVSETNHYSLVDVKLETGRTHQIRVHFSYLGYPLLGDDLYGGSTMHINRQALHCKSLTFTHPMSKKTLDFSSELPEDIKKLL